MTTKGKQSGESGPAAGAARDERFEQQLESLEKIVREIDSGELSLEQSVEAFERGVKLVRSLNSKLDEVEKRVEVLMKGVSGELDGRPYDDQPESVRAADKAEDDDDIPF